MSEQTEGLVFEHLRHLRAGMDRVFERLDDLTARVGRLEVTLAQGFGRIDIVLAEHTVRFEKIERRLDEIETHLGVNEA
jgi:tetrahydromethanopterin S-methyltransferase subunit G